MKDNEDQAFEWLTEAAKAGFNNIAHMEEDSDLDSLRDSLRYTEILKLMDGKME